MTIVTNGWLIGCGGAPNIPIRDASERDAVPFTHSDFHWGIEPVYMPAVRKCTAAIWFAIPRQV
jgi:hypothetical protein